MHVHYLMMLPFMYMNNSYILYMLPAFALALIAQLNVQGTFSRYGGLSNSRGYTGADVARMILDRNGLYGIRIERISGNLTDHYDPRTGVVRLSDNVFGSTSVAAAGVAAHETGHAIQHSTGYGPLKLRNAIIPVTQFGSSISIWMVMLGFILAWRPIALFGIALFTFVVLFQIVTLPVEFNASSRAMRIMRDSGILSGGELSGAGKVLRAAAMTYVASTVTAFAQLFWLLSLFGGSRDDRR